MFGNKTPISPCRRRRVIQKSMSLKYEPVSEPLHISDSCSPCRRRRARRWKRKTRPWKDAAPTLSLSTSLSLSLYLPLALSLILPLRVACEDPRPHAWSMCAACFCPVFPSHVHPHRVTYPYRRRRARRWKRKRRPWKGAAPTRPLSLPPSLSLILPLLVADTTKRGGAWCRRPTLWGT